MLRKSLVSVFVALVFFASIFFAGHASAQGIKLSFANYLPASHMVSPLMDKYCKELNKKLGGKAEVT